MEHFFPLDGAKHFQLFLDWGERRRELWMWSHEVALRNPQGTMLKDYVDPLASSLLAARFRTPKHRPEKIPQPEPFGLPMLDPGKSKNSRLLRATMTTLTPKPLNRNP